MAVKIVSVAEMRALEANAIASGTSEAALQERAGLAVAHEVAALVRSPESVAILVGPGNNGRDGAVAARSLAQSGTSVHVVLAPRHTVREDELHTLQELGARISKVDRPSQVEDAVTSAGVVVDALVGIGARGPLRDPLASLAAGLNAAAGRGGGATVVALDIPSGIDADSGQVPGVAVRADCTVTLGAVKQGLLRFPAAGLVGSLVPRDIGLPDAATAVLPYGCIVADELSRLVPPRRLDAHKYNFGRVLVVAGSDHYLGAAVLCATAAARAGAGLVTVASTNAVRASVAARVPEITYPETDVGIGGDPEAALDALAAHLAGCTALVVGPGLGRAEPIVAFVRRLLDRRRDIAPTCGLVVDADALFALAGWPGWWERLGANAILTPHSGELARLAGDPDATAAPWARAAELAKQWGCVLVAKGPFTSVASPNGRVAVWPRANAALATGGTGDVLAGLLAGLMAQGAEAWDAGRLATATHAMAAASVLARRGWRTLLASDLLAEIPAVLGSLDAGSRRR